MSGTRFLLGVARLIVHVVGVGLVRETFNVPIVVPDFLVGEKGGRVEGLLLSGCAGDTAQHGNGYNNYYPGVLFIFLRRGYALRQGFDHLRGEVCVGGGGVRRWPGAWGVTREGGDGGGWV